MARLGPVPHVEPVEGAEAVEAELAFTRPEDVAPDAERPGVLRRPDVDAERPEDRRMVLHKAAVKDCAALEAPDLLEHGFARLDLSGMAGLQTLLEQVRSTGHVEEAQAAEIRRSLAGRSFPLRGGRRVKLLMVAAQGFIMRKAGPNGMPVHAPDAVRGMNNHDGALSVHADQDIGGTPLRQMMHGAAPCLFHHEAPDSRNLRSPLFLLNLWIPLEQITRPLALMDRRSLDRKRHQLRLGLKVDSFIERDEARSVNHIWSFLHDEAQRWYFTSEMDASSAYLFDTLSTPHASFQVPGEDLAEARHRRLEDAMAAIDEGDAPALLRAAADASPTAGPDVTAPLRGAIEQMDALLSEAATRAAALCSGEDESDWRARALRAQQRVVRKSLEMRVIAVVTRDVWPFSRW